MSKKIRIAGNKQRIRLILFEEGSDKALFDVTVKNNARDVTTLLESAIYKGMFRPQKEEAKNWW